MADLDDDILGDFLSGFDIAPDTMSPLTAEEFVIQRLTEGKNAHIHVVRYNLLTQYKVRDVLKKAGVMLRKDIFEHGQRLTRELTDLEYAKIITEDYIRVRHHATLEFATHDGRGKVDMAKLMNMVCDLEVMKNMIEDTHFLRKELDG